MPWRPVNSAHAIERVRLVVQFRQPISEKLSAQLKTAAGAHSVETRMAGPTPLQTVSVGFQVTPDGQQHFLPPQTEGHGWQFVRMSSVNLPLEVLAVQGSQIIYETTEYRKWSTFMQRFAKVGAEVVALSTGLLDLDVVSLEYFDRFVFDGLPVDADPRLLLRDIEQFLHKDASSGQTQWHLHRGWFEMCPGGQVLINQNLDAHDAIPKGGVKTVRTLGVLTKAELRAANFSFDDIPVDDLYSLLHGLTGHYFKQAVQPEMLKLVGMSED